ncbi:hypothetical protein ACJX0J_042465, partial [Zea mays]
NNVTCLIKNWACFHNYFSRSGSTIIFLIWVLLTFLALSCYTKSGLFFSWLIKKIRLNHFALPFYLVAAGPGHCVYRYGARRFIDLKEVTIVRLKIFL